MKFIQAVVLSLIILPSYAQVNVPNTRLRIAVELPRVKVKPKYNKMLLSNRGLYYVKNKIAISKYFADEGESHITSKELSRDSLSKYQILMKDMVVNGANYNPTLLIEFIDATNSQPNMKTIDVDALIFMILAAIASDAKEDLKQQMDEMKKNNQLKRELKKKIKEMKDWVFDCTQWGNCPPPEIEYTQIQIKASERKLDSISQMSNNIAASMQASLDRMEDFHRKLSAILKKASEDSQKLIQDIK